MTFVFFLRFEEIIKIKEILCHNEFVTFHDNNLQKTKNSNFTFEEDRRKFLNFVISMCCGLKNSFISATKKIIKI